MLNYRTSEIRGREFNGAHSGMRWLQTLCRLAAQAEISTLDFAAGACAVVDVPRGVMASLSDISAHQRVVTDSHSCQSWPVTPRRLVGGAEAMGGSPTSMGGD